MRRLTFSDSACRALVSRCLKVNDQRGTNGISLSRRFAAPVAAICVVLPLSLACGSPVGRGTTLYRQQNYIEAAEAFERTQERLVTMKPVERARYGLYRGLTFMALGDLHGAERWFDYADEQQRTQPMVLPDNERNLLTFSRRELSQRIHDTWPKPANNITQGVAASAVAGPNTSAIR
jgi:hypothetical protein